MDSKKRLSSFFRRFSIAEYYSTMDSPTIAGSPRLRREGMLFPETDRHSTSNTEVTAETVCAMFVLHCLLRNNSRAVTHGVPKLVALRGRVLR